MCTCILNDLDYSQWIGIGHAVEPTREVGAEVLAISRIVAEVIATVVEVPAEMTPTDVAAAHFRRRRLLTETIGAKAMAVLVLVVVVVIAEEEQEVAADIRPVEVMTVAVEVMTVAAEVMIVAAEVVAVEVEDAVDSATDQKVYTNINELPICFWK